MLQILNHSEPTIFFKLNQMCSKHKLYYTPTNASRQYSPATRVIHAQASFSTKAQNFLHFSAKTVNFT